MSRSASALPEPPADLARFPTLLMGSDRTLWRAVSAPNPDPVGAWWFSSDGGRFDLPVPFGTCYMATNMTAAIRERLGRVMGFASLLPETQMHAMEVVALQLPGPATLANTGDAEAVNWGAIRELGSVTGDYERTVRWAAAFHDVGFEGVLYEPRFSSLAEAAAVGLFGETGAKTWPEGNRLTGAQAFDEADLKRFVVSIPSSKTVKIVAPPSRAKA